MTHHESTRSIGASQTHPTRLADTGNYQLVIGSKQESVVPKSGFRPAILVPKLQLGDVRSRWPSFPKSTWPNKLGHGTQTPGFGSQAGAWEPDLPASPFLELLRMGISMKSKVTYRGNRQLRLSPSIFCILVETLAPLVYNRLNGDSQY